MALHTDAVAGPVGKVWSVPRFLDDPAGCLVDPGTGHPGAARRPPGAVGLLDYFMDPLRLLVDLPHRKGPGQIGGVTSATGPPVDNEEVAGDEPAIGGLCMGIGAVWAAGDDRRKRQGNLRTMTVYNSIFAPSLAINLASQAGCAGQAGALTRLPCTWALSMATVTYLPPARFTSTEQAG